MQLAHVLLLPFLEDGGRDIDVGLPLLGHREATAYRPRDIRDDAALRQGDEQFVGLPVVCLVYVLQVGIDTAMCPHQLVEQRSLSVREVVFGQFVRRHVDLHARLRLMFLLKVNISCLGQDMQGRVGLQNRQVHHLA